MGKAILGKVCELASCSGRSIKLLTVAPEMPGVLELIAKCVEWSPCIPRSYKRFAQDIRKQELEHRCLLTWAMGFSSYYQVDNPI